MRTLRPLAMVTLALLGCDRPADPRQEKPSTTNTPTIVATPAPAVATTLTPSTGRLKVGEPYTLGTVRVTLRKARVGKVPLLNSDKTITYSDEPRLMLTVFVENLSERRKAHYTTWVPDLDAARSVASLKADGVEVKRVTFGFGNNVKDRTTLDDINPTKGITDLLVFEVPPAGKPLTLDLPGGNVGVRGTFQFSIASSDIGK